MRGWLHRRAAAPFLVPPALLIASAGAWAQPATAPPPAADEPSLRPLAAPAPRPGFWPDERVTAPIAPEAAAEALLEGGLVRFSAERLSWDEALDRVDAEGDVQLRYGGAELTADRVTWDRRTGAVEASGRVLVVDTQGNRLVGERMAVTETLADGFIEDLLLVLADGGRLVAARAERAGGRSTLARAVYSPCDPVGEDGCPRTPVWAVRAVRVTHDAARGRILYRRARLEFMGVPLVALPFLSHPDSTGRSQTGLLMPDIRYSRELGLEVAVPWHWAIAPDQDLTLTGFLFTAENPLVGADYRRLLPGGAVQAGVRATWADGERPDPETGLFVPEGSRARAYVEANGRLDHGRGWRSSFAGRMTNDRNFPGRYLISLDTRLRSLWRLENLGERHHFSFAGWAFQGLATQDVVARTPVALPLVNWRWRPAAEPLGGRLLVSANSLTLVRDEGQSMSRALVEGRWNRAWLTPAGQRLTATVLGRGDLYHVRDADRADEPFYAGVDGLRARVIPLAALDAEWPFAGPLGGGTQLLTPRVQLVASSVSANRSLPNEDSRAIDLEEANLFALNRFPGYDRWEGGMRLAYGADWLWRRPGVEVEAEAGQSYRLDEQRDIFPQGTGLSDRFSDFVGRATLRMGGWLAVTQRLRLDKDGLAIRRAEADLVVGSATTYASLGYLRFNRDIDLEDLTDHEELRAAGRFRFRRYWALFGSAVVDLTTRELEERLPGDGFQPIRHRLGVHYGDECFEFLGSWRRNYVDNPNARRGDTFVVTLRLRNLGI